MIKFLVPVYLGATASLFAAEQKVDVDLLRRQAKVSIQRMPEFANIATEASRRGLRVWALGGAASSFVDHAKHELLGANYSPRLEWNFNNVLLPEQDVDLVITRANGSAETAKEVEDFLDWVRQKYPYTTDGRSRWEAMGLKTSSQNGRKMAVGADPDFLLQHNDSLSLGMVEITFPPPGELPFRNLGNKTDFVRDIAESEFHFLYNQTHAQTARFKNGLNPPILSVIRALEKATRYNLDLNSDSVRLMKQIVAQWDPNSVQPGTYVYNYLHGRGKRVLTHAHDLEEALKLVDAIGLKNKLLRLPGADPGIPETLGWWLQRSPLPKTARAGAATGRTAGSLGIHQAFHWTSHANHRLMTWNYDANPRLFQSRTNTAGETAVLGEGFYTFANDPANRKYRNTKAADQYVAFEVNPAAREGIDFTYDKASETVVWKSSEHLKIAHQKTSYPSNLSCSAAFAGVANSANQAAQMLAAARAQSAARAGAPVLTSARPLHWRNIPTWIARNPVKSMIGGWFAYHLGDRFLEIATQGWDSKNASQNAPAAEKAETSVDNFSENRSCLERLAEGPACGRDLSAPAKKLAKILAQARPQNADKKSLTWLSGIKDESYRACVQKLSALNLAANFHLSEYLNQCDGKVAEPDLSAEVLQYWKKKQPEVISAAQFRALASVPEEIARRCAEAYPDGANVLDGNRLAACAALAPESLARLKPFLEEVKKAHNSVPLTVSKEMIDMGSGSAACYAALGEFSKNSSSITETCTAENPSPEALLYLRLALEKSGAKDWSSRGEEIKKFLQVYRTPESRECAATFMRVYNYGPMAKQPFEFCASAEMAEINKILPAVLSVYEKNRWPLYSEALPRLKALKTDLSRRCLQAVIDTQNWYALHETVVDACAAMKAETNLPYFARALNHAKNNRQSVEDFIAITANVSESSLKCREEFGIRGYNSFGPVAKAFCDHGKVAETNKILPSLLTFYKDRQISLTVEDAAALQLYSTDTAQECGQVIIGSGGWKPLYPAFAQACADLKNKENLPFLARALSLAKRHSFSVNDISAFTANPSVAALQCRDIMNDYGFDPFGKKTKAFCDHEQAAETNKILPKILSFLVSNQMSVTEENAAFLKVYNNDATRACGLAILESNKWNPIYEKHALACAAMKNPENADYLGRALASAKSFQQNVDDMSSVTSNTNLESLKCRELMAPYGYNSFGETARSFCDQGQVAATNKILPMVLSFYRNQNWTLKPEYAANLKLYSTELAQECGRAILATNRWNLLHEPFAKACASLTKAENLPFLARALTATANQGRGVDSIAPVTAAENVDSLQCREIFAQYGAGPFSEYVKPFCDHAKVAETNKFLPELMAFLRANQASLAESSAPMLLLFTTELARECGRTLMKARKNPHFEKFAPACAAMKEPRNIRYLDSALQYALKNQQSVDDISPVSANPSLDSLDCRELMLPYGFRAFGETIAAYCDRPDAKEMAAQLATILPAFRRMGWSLSTEQAEVLRKFQTPGAKDCLAQALAQGSNPLREPKAAECLAK